VSAIKRTSTFTLVGRIEKTSPAKQAQLNPVANLGSHQQQNSFQPPLKEIND
jgi:hypothetical protein